MRNWKAALGLVLILALAAVLRVQRIEADPPEILPSISGSAGIYFDEGIYCHNARNRILFGRWITDEWNPIVYSAPLTIIYYGAFRFFGISIVTVKAVNIVFGLAGILFFFGGLRSLLAPRKALSLTALFALNYLFMMYNRIGLLENFCVLGFLAGFYVFTGEGKKGGAFLLGAIVAMTSLSKYLYAYFLVSTLLAVAFRAWKRKDASPLFAYLAGVSAVALVWMAAVYLPFRETFSKIGSGWGMLSLPRSASQAWANLIHNPLARYLGLDPLAGFLLILFIGMFFWKLFRPRRVELEPVDIFVFFWIMGAVLSLGLLNYRPLRYYLPLIPAIYLGISLLARNRDGICRGGLAFWLVTLIPAALFWPFFRTLARRPSAFFTFPTGLRGLVWVGIGAATACFILPRGRVRTWVGAGLFGAMLATSGFLYVRHFYLTPTYDLERASAALSTLPPDSVIAGQEAPRLTLATPFKALLAYENWFNDEDLFARFQPTHLIVLDKFGGAELGWIRRRYPGIASRLEPIREFKVWDTTMTLYRVPR